MKILRKRKEQRAYFVFVEIYIVICFIWGRVVFMKRFLAILIGLALMVTSFGCTQSSEVDKDSDEQNEISIIISELDYNKNLSSYAEIIEDNTGIKVNFDIIETNTYEDYIKKLNVKLYLENGPTLIYIPRRFSYQKYAKQGVALDVTEKIPNLEKVYDSLLTDKVYFVPIEMSYVAAMLNKKVLDELDIEKPNLNWTKEEYLEMKEKWVAQEPRYFTFQEYNELVKEPLCDIEIFDKNEGVNLNTNDVREYIKEARDEIFSGKYLLDNSHYSFEDYYNIFIKGVGTKEFLKAMRFNLDNRDKPLSRYATIYAFQTLKVSKEIEKDETVILPKVIKYENKLYTSGFLVNRNGKNINLGIKFLNEMLDNQIQMIVYNNRNEIGNYPVNKEIEDEIDINEKKKNIHEKAIELRKYILKQIESGKIELYRQSDGQEQEFYKMLYKDTFKFIFAEEPYTDEEISRELEKLENKYNMWLNE